MRARTIPILFALAGCGATGQAPPADKTTPPAAGTAALGYDPASIDEKSDPCDDFFQYACGGWLRTTQIPPDKTSWGTLNELDERNLNTMRDILELAASNKPEPSGDDADRGKLGDYYAACMNEPQIEQTSAAEVAELFKEVDAAADLDAYAKVLAKVQLELPGAPLFAIGPQQDFKDATLEIALVDQGGIGLPDRDYYLADDAKHEELRKQYLAHVQKMLELAGEPQSKAAGDAQTVMRIEHGLATASMSRVDRRDPKKIYHRLELGGLKKTAPRFPWAVFFTALGRPDLSQINVAVPGYFASLNAEIAKTPLADWKTYLRWHALHGAAPSLGKGLVDENFRFYGKVLNGAEEIEPRWKRCVESADAALGESLGRVFVKRMFGDQGKSQTVTMIGGIERAMEGNLRALAWMDDATRAAALEKLGKIENKVGYPAGWRDYGKLPVTRASHFKNKRAAVAFEAHRQFNKIGKPVDRAEWEMTPPTVNAYYEPSLNEMVFPAGILEHPLFDRASPNAVNYGAIGMVMGHELTHGFDDEGRQFDGLGNLRDWWSEPVSKEFDRRAACVQKQFDGYIAVDELHENGKLTLGENIADLGGMKLAHAAMVAARDGKPPALIGGGKLNDEQAFFVGYAQAWCTKRRPENARLRVQTNPHSSPKWRVDGPLSNLPEFAGAFSCKPGAKMVRADRCEVW